MSTAIGALLLVCSYGADWLVVPHAHSDFGGMRNLPFEMTVTLTGTNGTIGLFGVSFPVWLAISAGLLSLVLMSLNQRGITSLPRMGVALPWIVSMVFVVVVISHAIGSQTNIRIGPVLAAAGLISGILSAWPAPTRVPIYQR